MLISKEKECRYCYEDNIKNLNKYCNCRGTLEFIHEKCLIEFINKTNNNFFKTNCPVCKFKYNYKEIFNYNSFIKNNVTFFYLMLFSFIFINNLNKFNNIHIYLISFINAIYIYNSIYNSNNDFKIKNYQYINLLVLRQYFILFLISILSINNNYYLLNFAFIILNSINFIIFFNNIKKYFIEKNFIYHA
jgi:hypothetical protein